MQFFKVKFSQLCNQYGCWLIIFAALATVMFHSADKTAAADNTAVYVEIQESVLTESSCPQDTEAAFRWDSFQRLGAANRVDNRSGGRQQSPVVPHNEVVNVAESSSSVDLLMQNCLQQYIEIKNCYYRKLWCRVLPTRAGPVHG